MGNTNSKLLARLKRKQRSRTKLNGTELRPRLSVFRSARHIYAQIIDDSAGVTLVAASTMEPDQRTGPKFDNKVAQATFIGKLIGERALSKGIQQVVFDRNGYLYHGRIKAVSTGAREAGLNF